MKNLNTTLAIILGSFILLLSCNAYGQREMEYLNRGVVAVRTSSTRVFVSWRMLGTEYGQNASYNLYRGSTLIASNLDVTNYVDNTSATSTYSVSVVIGGSEQSRSTSANIWSNFYKTVPISPPSGNHHANDASVGDLDNDGDYEFVLKWEANDSKDNSQRGFTDVVYLDGIEIDGTRKWRINLGKNIRAGAHYTQFMVYDLDGDGIAEVACKTAPGTRDGTGSYLSKGPAANDNDGADYRNSSGYILSGPEYLTIFNGNTGAEMATTEYVPARGKVSDWGDSYGNRVDRFLACIAYLDGTRPSLVMCRGYYTRSVLAAWDWKNGSLSHRWTFDTDNGYSSYAGQGNHQISVADVDNDGRDEIIYGAMAIDDNGSGLWNSKLGHGDAMHVSDIDPNRPGLEKWGIHEKSGTPGSALLDARTGAVIWKTGNSDVGRGAAADLSASHAGMECWGGTSGLRSATNTYVGNSPAYANFVIWWDGDLSRELCNADRIDKWENGSTNRLVSIYNYESSSTNNGTKKNPCLQADIIGDWREELITRSSDNTKLIIFTSTKATDIRMYTLMHDPVYRLGIAWQNVAYNQPPHTGFFFGNGMSTPPVPNIKLIGGGDPETGAISLTATATNEHVDLNWTSTNISTNQEVYRDTDSNPIGRVRLANVTSGVRDYTDASVTNGTTYYYWIKATDVFGNVVNSNAASANPGGNTITAIQENATGFCSVEGTIDNNNAGFTGDGFANTDNATGKGIDYKINVGTAGSYTILARIANGSSDRPANILLNGSSVGTLSMPGTGGWTSWSNTSTSVTLSPGTHDLRLEATTSGGLANVDYITISGTTLSAADCEGASIPTYSLTTSVSGSGTVTGAGTYKEGTTVTLTAIPASGYEFYGWSGALSGAMNPVSLTINSNTSVTANFSEVTNPTIITIQENEIGFCSVDGAVDNNNAGFTGDGFANTDNANGKGIAWSVNVPTADSYSIVFRYANGGSTDRIAQLMEDGTTVVSNFSMPSTGSWTSWTETPAINVNLSAGTKLIRLQATNSSGLANVDYLKITGNNPTPLACSGLKIVMKANSIAENESTLDANLYPVPVNNLLHISFNQELTESIRIQILDASGKLVISDVAKEQVHILDLSDISNGLYFVKMSNKNINLIKHITK